MIDFYEAACREAAIDHELFGLCDDEDGNKAYTDINDNNKWIATVSNPRKVEITFIAIDNCVKIFRENGDMENRCDGMLTYTDNIIFTELKNERSSWITGGLEQLDVTIKYFRDNHNLPGIKYKRAFLSNKKHPKFHVIESEIKKRFFHKYSVRINISGDIQI